MNPNQLKSSLLNGDRLALSKAITLIESQHVGQRTEAMALMSAICEHSGKAIRIGITGIPGVGKSTFIEQLGLHILSKGHKLAVLAIDPSSNRSAGSILGDKTRMENLSKEPNVFIRPSPSSGTLGGVAARTRESMLLCEAAGFDVIIVETVGVGQSETELLNITDTFLMLAMPGTGDELQGIKRGIMEAADLVVINKADGNNADAALRSKSQLEMALHLFPAQDSGWTVKVLTASALYNQGIEQCFAEIEKRQRLIIQNGWLELHRKLQQKQAFERITRANVIEAVMQSIGKSVHVSEVQRDLETGKLNEYAAAQLLLDELYKLLATI